MLNISYNRIDEKVDRSKYASFQILGKRSVSRILIRIMASLIVLSVLALFLPWTQNIRARGKVTTLRPDDRPQTIPSTLDGKIEKWYVVEGQEVEIGDTLVQISEVKASYMDPEILENTGRQIDAKGEALKAYDEKAVNLQAQVAALEEGRKVKLAQNDIKIEKTFLNIHSDSADLVAVRLKNKIGMDQLERTQNLYDKGLKALTELEAKRLTVHESNAKIQALENKIGAYRQELLNLKANRHAIQNEYADKIAKARSDRMSALSAKYDAQASKNKLQSQFNAYEVRQSNYYITSPINGRVTLAIKNGIGEIIKGGEPLVNIIPMEYKLAVESFIRPMDMPLLSIGQEVRVQFDGWPAIVFSGWPDSSYGTFGGRITAINDDISSNGKYRILIAPDTDELPWPDEVRVGGGANTLTLLEDVKVGYEVWRQLNGFPPDYYKDDRTKDLKMKVPLKKVK